MLFIVRVGFYISCSTVRFIHYLGFVYCLVFNTQIKTQLRCCSLLRMWIDFATETLCSKLYFDLGTVESVEIGNDFKHASSVYSATCLKRLLGGCKSSGLCSGGTCLSYRPVFGIVSRDIS